MIMIIIITIIEVIYSVLSVENGDTMQGIAGRVGRGQGMNHTQQ